MDRWGCVDVPALPLQLLLRRHPEWVRHPVAVVEEDKPTGAIRWVNERALRARILPGRRYAEGLSLSSELRAGVVGAAEVERAVEEVLVELRRFTPEVEPCAAEPGVFWLNATGLGGGGDDVNEGLYPSLRDWAQGIARALAVPGFSASVVVGFDRFGTYALARSGGGVRVMGSAAEERQLVDGVPLHRLGLDPALRDALLRLGVEDVGAFRRLPAGGLLARFGAEAYRLHRLAHGVLWSPLVAEPEVVPALQRHELDPEQHEIDSTALLFLCKQRLVRLASDLGAQGKAIAALRLCLLLEARPTREERVQPAEPTLDEVQLTDLLRLRLESIRLDADLWGFELHAEAVPARVVERSLFRETALRRDLAAGDRALARLRAELGDAAVSCAELREGHLPEARFGWRPLSKLRMAKLRMAEPKSAQVGEPEEADAPLRLVRRVLESPRLLASQRPTADGWFPGGLGSGPLQNLWGPYVISGGWWHREQHREYYFAETRGGEILWIYRDRRRGGWFLQGTVE